MSKTIMPLKKKLNTRGSARLNDDDLKQLRQNGTPIYPKIKASTIEVQLTQKGSSEKDYEGWLGEGEFEILKAGETRLKATLNLGDMGRVTFFVTDLSNVIMGNTQVVGGLLILPDGEGRYGDVTVTDDGHVDVCIDDTHTTTEVIPYPEHHDFGQELGCLQINGESWNIPVQQIVCEPDKSEGADTAKAIIVNGTPWNMPDYDAEVSDLESKISDMDSKKQDVANMIGSWSDELTPDKYPSAILVQGGLEQRELMTNKHGSVVESDEWYPTNTAVMNYVNSSIENLTACFKGAWDNWGAVPADESGWTKVPKKNDYLIVLNDFNAGHDGDTWKYIYNVDPASNDDYDKNKWAPVYKVNDKPLSSSQVAALDSGITKDLVTSLKALMNKVSELETEIAGLRDSSIRARDSNAKKTQKAR